MTDSDPQQLICLDGTLLPIMSQKKTASKKNPFIYHALGKAIAITLASHP